MRLVALSILVMLLIVHGCGKTQRNEVVGPQGPIGTPGSGCTVVQQADGALISCADGTAAIIKDGKCVRANCHE